MRGLGNISPWTRPIVDSFLWLTGLGICCGNPGGVFWWGEYLKSERHEVDDLQGYPYDERMAKSARDLAHGQDALTVGVLVGAFVSPGFASKIPGFQVEKCPWCDCEGFFQHVAWECPGVSL